METLARQLHLSEGAAWALAALIGLQIAVQVVALVDLYRRDTREIRTGKKWLWVLIILLGELIGPIIYFAAGRVPRAVADRGRPAGSPEAGRSVADLLYGEGTDRE